MTTRLTYLVSHPIQYQAPLLRRIAQESDIALRVVFEKQPKAEGGFDPGFRRAVTWDVPLVDGYEHIALDDTDLVREIRSADVLWVHGWQTSHRRRALSLSRRQGTPVLMRGENCDIAMPDGAGIRGWLKRLYLRRIFRNCDAFLAIGTENRRYYERRGIDSSLVFSMPYAIDNEQFARLSSAPDNAPKQVRAKLGIPDDRQVILFVGKFLQRKHPEQLVEAIRLLPAGVSAPVLVFVGDGELERDLRRVTPDSIFLGFRNQSEMPSLYGMADILVVPSEREPWGLVVNEAMACGTAAIVSDQVGCGVDLIGEERGAVFPTNDVNALASALARCLPKAQELGRNAARWIGDWGFEQDIQGLRQAIDFVQTTKAR